MPPGRRVLIAVLLPAVLAGAACGPTPALPAAAGLDEAAATALMMSADAARSRALAGDPSRLDGCFRGPALALLRRQAASAARRTPVEERVLSQRLVHLAGSAEAVEAVLEVESEIRAGGARSTAPWSRSARQWWALLRPGGDGWRVEDSQDLPPDHWWRS